MAKKKKEVSVIDLIEEIEDKLAELKDKVDDQQDDFEDTDFEDDLDSENEDED
jgi:hypothetical protein